jgi:hypothetical protein
MLCTGLQEIVALSATLVCSLCNHMICPGWTLSAGLQKIVALSATMCVVCATTFFCWRWVLCTGLQEIVALSATPVCSLCGNFHFVVGARRSALTGNRGTQCHTGVQSVQQLSFCR